MKKTNINLPSNLREKEQLYLRDKDVADILGISIKSLYNKINLQHPLPAYICPPSTRVRLWPVKEFHAWLSRFRCESSNPSGTQIHHLKRRK